MNNLFRNMSFLSNVYLSTSDVVHLSSVLIMIMILIKFNN